MEYVKLKDICFFLPKSKIKAGEGMDNGKYIFFTSSDTKVSKINEYLYDDEAVIIGTGGKPSCNYCKGKFSVSTDNFVLKSNTINIKYLYYFLRNNNLSILEKGFHGAGLKHISKDYVSDINVPLLDYSKQCKIVSTLNSIYININFYKDQLKNFDNIVKSQFIEMFGEPLYNIKGYTKFRWNDITNFITYGLTVRPEYREKGIPLISARELKNRKIDYDNAPLIDEDDYNKLSDKAKPNAKEVFMSKTGTIGITAIFNNDCKIAITQNIARINLKENVNEVWFIEYLNNYDINNLLNTLAKGNTIKDLQIQDMKKIVCYLPPIKSQNQFASFVEQIDKSKYFEGGIP